MCIHITSVVVIRAFLIVYEKSKKKKIINIKYVYIKKQIILNINYLKIYNVYLWTIFVCCLHLLYSCDVRMCDNIFYILHFFLRSSRFYLNITILLYNIDFTKKKEFN